jgi:hypothetical protein
VACPATVVSGADGASNSKSVHRSGRPRRVGAPRVSKRKEGVAYPYKRARHGAGHGLHSSTTTSIPKSPNIPSAMRRFIGRDSRLSGMAPYTASPPGHHQRSSPTSLGIHQQPQPQPQSGYPDVPVGSMDERYTRSRRVDQGQSPTALSIVQQQQQITSHTTQQHQSQSRAGTGAHPTNIPIFQLPQPSYGYPPTSANGQHAHLVPTQGPTVYAAPTSAAPPQWTHGGSAQGQEQSYYHSAHAAYAQIKQTQPYHQPLFTSSTPAGAFSLADNPPPSVPSYLAQANLDLSGETPNSGAAPGGLNVSIAGIGTMGQLTSSNQQLGPSHSNRTNRKRVLKPYKRPTPAAYKKTRPVPYEGNLLRLQQRCRRQGADEGAIGLLGKVFAHEVSLEALTRQLTDEEVEANEFGAETGSVYIALLETTNEEEGLEPRYVCRLCHSEQTWMHHKDVVRHLRRDHFGLADDCYQWYVFGGSLMLVGINIFPGNVAAKHSIPKGR